MRLKVPTPQNPEPIHDNERSRHGREASFEAGMGAEIVLWEPGTAAGPECPHHLNEVGPINRARVVVVDPGPNGRDNARSVSVEVIQREPGDGAGASEGLLKAVGEPAFAGATTARYSNHER